MGDRARVYLGSAVLAAVAALRGKLPTVEEYMAVMKEKVEPASAEIHRYLYFDEMGEFPLHYTGARF
jgi:aconitate hydratase 2/2-methylisocitrate dehydratase